ncbi:ribosome maturation factor RimP [uncultured Anaerococcus sp.]|uniref:ribosome maturation factor RimP n=1 Tax=uncultured Anaerococcus sp. TaxID=293428 RepID=UPI00280AE4D1|nr:ribosome maturation factor RimP [uncultured Anaerococcus sp.]MDU5148829.1 ribosome maturation factor RimP [Anaerococcus prevotii]
MDLTNRLREIFEADISELGYELVDIEYKGSKGNKILTFFIFNEEGITIDDCEKVSAFLDTRLDELDLIKDSYYLEVSSQDLSRPLKTDRDIERNINEVLKVKMKDGEVFLGKVSDINEDTYEFDLEDGTSRQVNKSDVKQINIEIVF